MYWHDQHAKSEIIFNPVHGSEWLGCLAESWDMLWKLMGDLVFLCMCCFGRPATCLQFQMSEEFSQSWASFWSPTCSPPASWVTSQQLKLNKIQFGFCGFLKEPLFPLPGAWHECQCDPLYCSRASEWWSVTAAATGQALQLQHTP